MTTGYVIASSSHASVADQQRSKAPAKAPAGAGGHGGRAGLRIGVAARVVPAVVAVMARLLTGPHTIDDAYITFRYARNLAEGTGLVYNLGEWVLGTSAPLWAILLGAGYRLGLTDLPALATAISSAADAASVALLVHWSMRLGWQPLGAACVGLAWALNPMSIAFATGGMETSLFVLGVLAALGLSTVERRQPLAALLGGMTILVRPGGALLAIAVIAWTWAPLVAQRATLSGLRWRSTVPPLRHALLTTACGLAPITLVGLALWQSYGSPLPNSVAAKQAAYQAVSPFENAIALVIQAGLPGWSTFFLGVVPAGVGLLLAALGVVALFELVRRSLPWLNRRAIAWQPFAGFAALYLAFYVVVGLRGIRLFPWYLVPIVPFYLLGASIGLAHLGAHRSSWLAAVLLLWQLPAIDWHQPLLPAGDELGREQLLLAVGRDLAVRMPSTAVVAAPEIGALGYASRLRMLDTVGLVSPRAIAYYPLPADQLVADNAIPARLIADVRPDVVVTLDAFADRSLLPDPDFQRAYRIDRSFPARVWQSQTLLIFRRADSVDAR